MCNYAASRRSGMFRPLGETFHPPYWLATPGKLLDWKEKNSIQDERCDNVLCPTATQCDAVDGEPDETRCICATGYEGYGSVLDAHGTIIELCRGAGPPCLNEPYLRYR